MGAPDAASDFIFAKPQKNSVVNRHIYLILVCIIYNVIIYIIKKPVSTYTYSIPIKILVDSRQRIFYKYLKRP
jgi:hypothetical protein